MFSMMRGFGRPRLFVTPQQYIVPDATVPPYSSQTSGHDGQLGSLRVKSSNPCEMNPVTAISLWLYAARSFFSWQSVKCSGCEPCDPPPTLRNKLPLERTASARATRSPSALIRHPPPSGPVRGLGTVVTPGPMLA